MNPLSNVRFIKQLNEKEVKLGINENASWHNEYKDSAWVFVGGLSYELTEGDVVCVFSQYGEIVNINLVRDKATGKSKGYCFICYEDQRSTVLAVDNLNGIKLCSRVIRVDHVANYKVPKDFADTDPLVKKLRDEGCGPEALKKDSSDDIEITDEKKRTVQKVEKNFRRRKASSSEDEPDQQRKHTRTDLPIKREKHDPGYNKYDTKLNFHKRKYDRKDESKSSKSRRHRSRSSSRSPQRSHPHKRQDYFPKDTRQNRSRRSRSVSKSPERIRHERKERRHDRSCHSHSESSRHNNR